MISRKRILILLFILVIAVGFAISSVSSVEAAKPKKIDSGYVEMLDYSTATDAKYGMKKVRFKYYAWKINSKTIYGYLDGPSFAGKGYAKYNNYYQYNIIKKKNKYVVVSDSYAVKKYKIPKVYKITKKNKMTFNKAYKKTRNQFIQAHKIEHKKTYNHVKSVDGGVWYDSKGIYYIHSEELKGKPGIRT